MQRISSISGQAAKTIDDVAEPLAIGKPMTVSDAARLLADELKKKARHYADRSQIDLVAYFDIRDCALRPDGRAPDPKALNELKRQGWRSVSFFSVPYSVMLVARDDAPSFLRERAGGF
jgi:hypothetical protein